ncbi:metallophosphoesterase [soil metagenome]
MRTFLFILFYLVTTNLFAQNDSLEARIIIIGDAGQFTKGKQPVINSVRKSLPLDKKTTIVFVGDNLYKNGLPFDDVAKFNLIKAPLDSQIVIARGTQAKVYFIPGNHDWLNGGKDGWAAIQREQNYIDNYGQPNVKFYPEDGCPGPVEVKISDNVVMIIIDSQWWIHPYDKPGIESDCPYKTKAEVLSQLDDILSKNNNKLVIFAIHHTLKSVGIHGGYFKLKQHIFPFTDAIRNLYIPMPIIGSIYPITRAVFGTSEDLRHPAYQSMINDFQRVVKGHKNVIFIAGHEHTLQLIQDSSYTYMVSGSGSKATRVYKNKRSLFASDLNGYATLEISKNKNVTANYYTVDKSDSTKLAYSGNIMNFYKVPVPEATDTTLREIEYAFADTVVISASDKYKKATGFKRKFLGNNYREEWSTPVKFKVFNIRKEMGGFKMGVLGGGKQSKSLRLIDKLGREWTLRSVDKDPEKALPENLRGTLAQDIVQDMISASHPYAPLVVAPLAKAAGVVAADPKYFFVPNDPALGIYRKLFANTVCMLEMRDPTPDTTDSKSTAKTINKIIGDNDKKSDQPSVLRARLLDMMVGDWDRHFDQWKWGKTDSGKTTYYYPIPRDRDQAFYNSDGLLATYIGKNQLKFLQGFKKNIPDVKWFNWEERDLDRFFMNELTETDWKNIIQEFQNKMTDAVIDDAVKKLPPEIYAIDGKMITEKLKGRRNVLMNEGMKYYRFISREVTVHGTNDAEYFQVSNTTDNKVQVLMRKRKKTSEPGAIVYNRVFDPSVTKEIRLFGLNNDDHFDIADNVNTKIKLRIIGGRGNDTFDIKGKINNKIYDFNGEKNEVLNSKHSYIDFSDDPANNTYKPVYFTYNKITFPQINIGYNPEDKLMAGFGFSRKTYGFRKDPYSTYQKLSTLYAFNHGAYQVRYQGIFNSVLRKNDIILNAEFINPTLNNFFGFGNETVRDPEKPLEYYRVRYKNIQADLLIRKRFNDVLHVSAGPSYYHYWSKFTDNKERILSTPTIIGSDSAGLYTKKDYLGGKIKVDINFINNEFFPSRGIVWNTEYTTMYGIGKASNNVSKITSDMSVYASLTEERKLMAVFRMGAGHIFSENFEYFQALTLGANNYVRGFRKNRFTGSSLFYASIEPRVKLFQSKWYILPGDVGLIGFYDIGRVWTRIEASKKWHQSYGGGIYYSPFNLVLISATVGISDEDKLFNFSLGTKFNLTF